MGLVALIGLKTFPIDSKNKVWCNLKKKRYSVMFGEKSEYYQIEEYNEGDISDALCAPLKEPLKLYII